jgi:broad specificity phosphatase PhoE
MTETVLGLLRHGQTDWNITFRIQGSSDIPLNDTGVAQAHAAAAVIDPNQWDVILSSPLSRARDTAAIVAQRHSFSDLAIEPLLTERAFGEAEGMEYADWKSVHTDQAQIPGIETLEQLEQRVNRLLETIASRYSGKRVLAVSHGALIRKVVRVTSNKQLPLEGQRFSNASLSTFIHKPEGWQILEFNPQMLGQH